MVFASLIPPFYEFLKFPFLEMLDFFIIFYYI